MTENKKPWANQYVHTCKERPDDFCNACYQKDYRSKNRTALIKDGRNRYKQTREEISAQRRKRYREDEEYRNKIKAQQAKYYKIHREKIIARECAKKFRYNPGGSRRVYWEMTISLLIQRDGPNCQLCGNHVDISEASVDHIVEIRKGADHSAPNIRLAHRVCNMKRPRTDYKPSNYDKTIE